MTEANGVSLREHLEGLARNLVEQEMQRWAGHEQVHGRDQIALVDALERTEKAIELAQTAHRREHEIERRAQETSDAAHQLRHEQMNEIREQLNDQARTFVREDVFTANVAGLERRITEMVREQTAYRDESRDELLRYRDALQQEIASLRESRSMGQGGAERTHDTRLQSNWSTALTVTIVFSALSAMIGAAALLIALFRH
jgi:hypothetical protein